MSTSERYINNIRCVIRWDYQTFITASRTLYYNICVNVKGNLRRNCEFWKHIGTPSFILNVIERGYFLPFVSFPEPAVFKEAIQV